MVMIVRHGGQGPPSSRRGALVAAEHQVHVLDGLPGAALDQVVDDGDEGGGALSCQGGSAATPISAKLEPDTATTSGSRWVGQAHERLVRERIPVQGGEPLAVHSAGSSTNAVTRIPRTSGAETGTKRSWRSRAPADARVSSISGTCWC